MLTKRVSRLAWGLKGYRDILVAQTAIITCWYSIHMVYGYLVSNEGFFSNKNARLIQDYDNF